MSACAFPSGTPWDQSVADPLSGQRTAASLLFRSSSSACGTCTLKGVTSFVAGVSANCAVFVGLPGLPWALVGASPADNIPAPLAATAARMNLRREVSGTETPVLFFKSLFMDHSSSAASVRGDFIHDETSGVSC